MTTALHLARWKHYILHSRPTFQQPYFIATHPVRLIVQRLWKHIPGRQQAVFKGPEIVKLVLSLVFGWQNYFHSYEFVKLY